MQLDEHQRRQIAVLRQTAGDDPAVASLLESIDAGIQDYQARAEELRASGMYTEAGVSAQLRELREAFTTQLDKGLDRFAARVEALEAKATRSLPEPEVKLDAPERDALVQAFRAMSNQERRDLVFRMHESPRMAAALASLPDETARHLGISPFTLERAAMISHGGQRNPETGRLEYPNAADHANVRRAQTLFRQAHGLVESFRG